MVSNFSVKSQWLYFLPLDVSPKRVPDSGPLGRHFALPEDVLPQLVTPLEKKLGMPPYPTFHPKYRATKVNSDALMFQRHTSVSVRLLTLLFMPFLATVLRYTFTHVPAIARRTTPTSKHFYLRGTTSLLLLPNFPTLENHRCSFIHSFLSTQMGRCSVDQSTRRNLHECGTERTRHHSPRTGNHSWNLSCPIEAPLGHPRSGNRHLFIASSLQ